MKLLLVTADGASQMIDYPDALPLLRVPFRVRYSVDDFGATVFTREYMLVDELRSHAMKEPLFVYEERLPGRAPIYAREGDSPMCRDIRRAADPSYGLPNPAADATAQAVRPPAEQYGRGPFEKLLADAFRGDLPPSPTNRRVVVHGATGVRELEPPPAPTAAPSEGRPVSQLELTMFLVDHPRSSKQDQAAAILERFEVRHRAP